MKKNIVFKEYIEKWLQAVKISCKLSTFTNYEYIVKARIMPVFGTIKKKQITEEMIINFTSDLINKGLKPKTIKDILVVLKQILGYAGVDVKVIMPKTKKKEITILEKEDQIRLENLIKRNLTEESVGVYLSLYMGLRIGELCALKWKNIDLDKNIIKVEKTLIRVKNTEIGDDKKTIVILTDPKSTSSIRNIPIPLFLIDILKELKKEEDYFFLTGKKEFIEPRNYSNHFKNMLTMSMIEKNYNFHTLRHTFATHCIEVGFDPKTLSEILGHANVNITLDRYVHPSFETKVKMMNTIKPVSV